MQTRSIAIVLIVIGILMMIYTGFTYVTTKRVADIGPVKIDKEEHHPVRWSPIAGTILLVGGIALLATSKNQKAA